MLQNDDNTKQNPDMPESLLRYITTRTRTDMLRYAKDQYGIEWKQSIEILKAAGFEKWDPMKWFDYLNVLREHWPYLKEAREEETRRRKMQEAEYQVLIQLAAQARYVEWFPGQWRWEGPEESFRARDVLASLEREKKIKEFKQKAYPFGTPISNGGSEGNLSK